MIWLDAGLATVLATIMTAAFYLLGAAVLHREEIEPTGLEVVDQISKVYTESFGEWSKVIYVFGAFCVLYSTLIVVAAATAFGLSCLSGAFSALSGAVPTSLGGIVTGSTGS